MTRPEGAAPTQLSRVGAERLTAKIRALLGEALNLIGDAWESRIWEALDLPTWEAYVEAHLPELALMKLPIDVRRDAVADWAARGMPQRAMAAGLNVAAGTIASDAKVVVPEGGKTVSADGSVRTQRRLRVVDEPVAVPEGLSQIDLTIWLVAQQAERGLTVKELMHETGWHHGIASCALSRAHKKRHAITPTVTFRLSCAAYVLTEVSP